MSAVDSRLIVSFIGGADLRAFGPAGTTLGPILRLLDHLARLGLCQPNTRLMLFDDKPADGVRKEFCKGLEARLPGLGIKTLTVDRHPIELAEGPTDLNALYHAVWSAIPAGDNRPDEVIFHVSSGTPAMQVTLLLAANCLPLDQVRLFETSVEHNVLEMALPYVIAMRENKAARTRDLPRLSAPARKHLSPYTVVEDPIVEAAYAALHKAATRRRGTPTVLISGPSGSGKWHTARQFAAWRAAEASEWLSPTLPASLDADRTVLIRRLDAWPTEKLTELSAWRLRHSDIAVAATWRTDVVPAAPLAVVARQGLVGAEQVLLPALSARGDIVALGESMAAQNGIWDGKIKQRLQYDLLTDVYPRNLHDLKTVLATAASRSKGDHPERAAYLQADQLADIGEAQALLYEAYQVLAGLHFGKGRPDLSEILDIVRAVVMRCAQAPGRTEKQVGELLGSKQQSVSKSLKQKIRLSDWRTRLSLVDEKAS